MRWYNCENGTGGYLVCLAPWKLSGAEELWEGSQSYPKSSQHFNTAAMSPCRHPVVTCGVLFGLRGLMAPTLMSESHPSHWKATKMRRRLPLAFTGRAV